MRLKWDTINQYENVRTKNFTTSNIRRWVMLLIGWHRLMNTFMHGFRIESTRFPRKQSTQRISNAFLFLLLLISRIDTIVIAWCGILRTYRTRRILMSNQRKRRWLNHGCIRTRKRVGNSSRVHFNDCQLLVMSAGIIHMLRIVSSWIRTHTILILNTGWWMIDMMRSSRSNICRYSRCSHGWIGFTLQITCGCSVITTELTRRLMM